MYYLFYPLCHLFINEIICIFSYFVYHVISLCIFHISILVWQGHKSPLPYKRMNCIHSKKQFFLPAVLLFVMEHPTISVLAGRLSSWALQELRTWGYLEHAVTQSLTVRLADLARSYNSD